MSDNNKPVVLALGFFDSVHKGHQKVIDKAFLLAKEGGYEVAVFTFYGNLKKAIGNEEEKCVYTAEERKIILNSIGVENIFFAPTSREFLSMDKKTFLDFINTKYEIKAYVTGKDYRFGKGGEGDVEYLKEYAKALSQKVLTVDTYIVDGEKVSSSLVKGFLKEGDIEKVNSLIGRNYSITGKVARDRGVGTKLGFPTANVELEEDKLTPKKAVYYGSVEIDGCMHGCIINLGARPTFNLDKTALEVYILDFDGDLYDREIKINFEGYIREIIKFERKEDLVSRLEKDKKFLIVRKVK